MGERTQDCAESHLRELGDGKELTASAMSSLCSSAPQCSLHLIFQRRQQIREEACPEIVIWMNVTFVGQRGELGELMALQPSARILQPGFPNNVHVWRRSSCQGGKIQLGGEHKVRREGGRKGGKLAG